MRVKEEERLEKKREYNKGKGEGKEQERKKKGRNLVKEIIFANELEDHEEFNEYYDLYASEKQELEKTNSEEVEEHVHKIPSNQIFLDGFVCKPPVYRKTPLGREIADLLVAVNRQYGKSDYIPCIAWGRNAKYASEISIGANIQVVGRVQSREYSKKIDDERTEIRVAYEVSVSQIKKVADKVTE